MLCRVVPSQYRYLVMTTSRYDDDGSSSRRNTQKEIDLMLLALPFPSAADQTLDDRAIKPPPSVRLLESPVTSLMSWHAVKAIRGARHSLPLFCFYFGGIKQEAPFSRRRHVPLLSGAATVEPPDRINHGGCTRHYRPLVIDWKPLLPARLCFIADPFFFGHRGTLQKPAVGENKLEQKITERAVAN